MEELIAVDCHPVPKILPEMEEAPIGASSHSGLRDSGPTRDLGAGDRGTASDRVEDRFLVQALQQRRSRHESILVNKAYGFKELSPG